MSASSILAIADIIEDAMMHREICNHAGLAAYERVRDAQQLLQEGSVSPDEARHMALADLRRALETPRLPDALHKRNRVASRALETYHA